MTLENDNAPLRAWELARRALGFGGTGADAVCALDEAYEWAHGRMLSSSRAQRNRDMAVAELVRAWRAFERCHPDARVARGLDGPRTSPVVPLRVLLAMQRITSRSR